MATAEEDGSYVLNQEDAAKKTQHIQIATFTTVSLCRPQPQIGANADTKGRMVARRTQRGAAATKFEVGTDLMSCKYSRAEATPKFSSAPPRLCAKGILATD